MIAKLNQMRVWKATAPDLIVGVPALVNEGTPEEKKEFIRLVVEEIKLDAEKRVAACRTKKFPAPNVLDAGNLLRVVAGVRDEQQKIVFPPVDIVEIPLVLHGRVLVPAAA
jgi:hypothetical protein